MDQNSNPSFQAKIPKNILEAYASKMNEIGEIVGRALVLFSEKMMEIAKRASETMQLRLDAYPALKNEILPLARRGWFISKHFGMSELDLLAQKAISSSSELDALLASIYRVEISDHVRSILQEYPNKEFLLKPALEAHLRGEYSLSIPVFFMIIDGIALERADRYFFLKRENEYIYSVAQAELKELSSADKQGPYLELFNLINTIMWESISEKLPFAFDERLREKHGYGGLNRHLVLHGEFREQDATEENSLKAFSLLSCVSGLLADYGKPAVDLSDFDMDAKQPPID